MELCEESNLFWHARGMDENKKIDLIYRAGAEVRMIQQRAKEDEMKVYRQLVRDLQNEACLSHSEAIYELYMLGIRFEDSYLEA